MPPFPTAVFRREEHVYRSAEFSRLLADAIRFFNGSPVHALPPPKPFAGAGVYAIYCTATEGPYATFGLEINRYAYNVPIYAGKAVPPGWRQNRNASASRTGKPLYNRLRQHATSIEQGAGLKPEDFFCRFVIFEDATAHMVAAVEAGIIEATHPLWNSVVDGFGNHDPGSKRKEGHLTAWDSLHPGRAWTEEMTGDAHPAREIKRRVADYLAGLCIR